MAFLLPPEEIVYYHYQLQQDRAHDAQRVSAHHALSPAVIDSDSKQSLQEEEERP